MNRGNLCSEVKKKVKKVDLRKRKRELREDEEENAKKVEEETVRNVEVLEGSWVLYDCYGEE